MKILTVTYRTNRPTLGSKYIHEHVEATATVDKNESPAQALAKLKAEVHALLYPELINLRQRIAQVAPIVYACLSDFSDAAIVELYHEHAEALADLLKGDMAQFAFISEVLG